MKKNKLLIILSSIIAIYAIIGFVAIPKILKPQIETAINENITEKASLEKIEFNPFLLKFSLHNLKIFNEKETTVSIDKLLVDFSIIKSIDEQHISFRDLQLINPYVNIIENPDGTLNLQKLAKEKKEENKKEESKSNIKFQIYKTILDNARIKFTKLSQTDEPFKIDINKLNYTFYDMGTYRNTLASHSLRILINKHSELVINGGVRLDPFKMNGNVELKNFRPAEFLTYKKEMLNFDLDEKTYLDLQFGYKIDAETKLKLEIDNANLNLKNLDIKQKDNSILSLEQLALENLNLDYPQNLVTIDSLFLNKLNAKAISNKEGQLNFANLIVSNKKPEEVVITEDISKDKEQEELEATIKTEETPIDTKKDISKEENEEIKKEEVEKVAVKEDTKQNPWKVILKQLNIKDSNISFDDLKNALFVDTKNINIDLSNFKLNGNNFTLEKVALSKPTINLNDKKNSLSLFLENFNLNLNNFKQNSEELSLEAINLSTPKITFKDSKNKLDIFTKKTSINLANLKKVNQNIDISSINLKNPSLFLQDNKNSLKILTNNLSLNVQTINLNNKDFKIAKTKLQTPTVKFEDLKNKTTITTEDINLIATNSSMIKERLKVAILSLTKPTIYLIDNKNDKTIVANKINLKINGVENYKNSTKVAKVNLYEPNVTIKDRKNKTDIVAKNIYLNVQKISHKNNKLKIVRSSINKPYISITLGKQAKVEKDDKDTKTAKEEVKTIKKVAKKKKSDFEFDIGPVKIKDMKMTFEDKNLPIPFKTDITKLNGNFSRLHSSSSKPTKLQLEGKVDKYGYTKITGTVDINDIKLLTDTNLLFKNIAIKNFTPYSGKFVGRKIDAGKLDLDLKYNIKKSDLNAQNVVVISNIKLGDKVDSPDAANLPLDLAIALLENSEGVIDIDLPVKGNVDDPQFSIAPIIWKVFTNLIVKAISAPFSLLAAVFGIDEEKIKSIEFEFGKSDIIASEKEALDNIAKILSKKPKLAIKVKPTYDPIKDKIALQDIKFDKFLEKKMEKIPQGDEYKEALEDLYKDYDKVKELDEVEKSFTRKDKKGKETFDNDAYVEYLRKFLASKQKVSEQELVSIAKKRIANINNYLIKGKKVSPKAIKIDEMSKQSDTKAKWAVFKLDIDTK